MKITTAKTGFLLSLRARGYAPATIELYRYVLDALADYLDDPEVNKIRLTDLERYFVYLRDEYKPTRKSGDSSPLSGSTLQNHWKGIRAFFAWAVDELRLKSRPDLRLKLPKNNPKLIRPLKQDEIKSLLIAAERTQEAVPSNRRPFTMRRPTADRDSAILLMLLDTGVRVGELARMTVDDVNLKTGEVIVTPFGESGRKTKGRAVFIGKSTMRVLWRYLANRGNPEPEEPLLLSRHGHPMSRNSIRLLLADMGKRAGVANVHPHRFRHTFAIEFLRNDGDVFSLQRILGHADLETVKKYLELAQADTQNAHKRASPADRWNLSRK
ncbi:MAG: tyrosine-type recombinase/integrase [Bacteroidetes bacterium]|nr:tyrosine-type recombinase/integrase [Bacteroidota bacterium]